MELIDVTKTNTKLTNDNIEKQFTPNKDQPLIERIYDIVTNLYFIIFFLISLNLIVISVWLYGLFAAITR